MSAPLDRPAPPDSSPGASATMTNAAEQPAVAIAASEHATGAVANDRGHGLLPKLTEVLPSLRAGGLRFFSAGALPLIVFYVAFRFWGPIPGILAGMAFSLVMLGIQAMRLGRLDPIVVVPMLVILANGSVAILTGSVELYLAAPAVEAFIWGVVLIGSIVVKRPLVPLIARELGVIPARFASLPGLRRSLELLTFGWGIAAFAKAALRLWLLTFLPLEAFLIVVTLGIMSINTVMLGLSVWLPFRMARTAPAPHAA